MKKWQLIFIPLGTVAAIYGVLAPVHEFWHWLFAILSGQEATMHWSGTYIYGDISIWTAFAGMYGEVTVWSIVIFRALKKRRYWLSAFLYGYLGAFALGSILYYTGQMDIIDLDVAVKAAGQGWTNIFFGIYNIYLASMLIVQGYGIIWAINRKAYFKRVQKNLKNLDKIAEIRENGYKPLTLVK